MNKTIRLIFKWCILPLFKRILVTIKDFFMENVNLIKSLYNKIKEEFKKKD